MGAGNAAASSCSINKRKVNLLKKKRRIVSNKKKVNRLQYKSTPIMVKPGKSKKKMKKDEKKKRICAKYEQEKLLASGVITQEDIEQLQQKDKQSEIVEDESMDM